MWPFKSRIPVVKDIIFENEGQTVTIIHEKGAHKFNKEEVLDAHFSSDAFSGPKIKWNPIDYPLFSLMFFGGFLNMLMIFYPFKVSGGDLTEHSLPFEILYYLVLPLSLTLIFIYLCSILIRYLRSKYDDNYSSEYENILIIKLNHVTIKTRIRELNYYENDYFFKNEKNKYEHWKFFLIELGYVKQAVKEPKENYLTNLYYGTSNNIWWDEKKVFNYKIIFIFYLPIIFFLTYFNWDKPFWFWQFIENFTQLPKLPGFKTFMSNHQETFDYWKYYGHFRITNWKEMWEQNESAQLLLVKSDINSLNAFYDGALGGLYTGLIPVFIFIVILCSLFFLLCELCWPLFVGFLIYTVLYHFNPNFRLVKINLKNVKVINWILFIAIVAISIVVSICFEIWMKSYYGKPYISYAYGWQIGLISFVFWWVLAYVFEKMKPKETKSYIYEYPSITIGNQNWMNYDLSVTSFKNGEPIQIIETADEWIKAGENKQAAAYKVKGIYLYNWYAVNDPRGLAPEGWRLSSENDWKILLEHIKKWNVFSKSVCDMLKSETGWDIWFKKNDCKDCKDWTDNYRLINLCNVCKNSKISSEEIISGNGINTFDFNAKPNGGISEQGIHGWLGKCAQYWSSSEFNDTCGIIGITIPYNDTKASIGGSAPKISGFTVRCLKDELKQ